jgi:major membrane immunogen (membrane-anchored lipoprotein)
MKFQKSQLFGVLAFLLCSPIPWLYFNPPDILAGQPLAVYVVFLFFGGLSCAATALLISLRARTTERAARIYVFLFVLAFVGAYQFSGLAPSWQCFGKKLETAVGRAAGQNCTTTCTDNDTKPCSGWSSCWDKFVSCSSEGKDQDGRNCNGCCFSCDIVCEEEEPPPPSSQPPTVSGTVACSQSGSNGWCIGSAALNLFASDPQGFALTISGTIDGSAFTCAVGNSCSIALAEGNGSITYKATAATSGLSSATGSTAWKRDVTVPGISAVYPAANGANGWHKTSPVSVSTSGSDAMSGLASAQVSINGGPWQTSASLTNGTYTVNFRTMDNAGNSSTISRTIKVDSTPPTVNPVVPSPDGRNNWFVTAPVNVSVNGADTGSGLASALLSVDGSTWQPNLSLDDGVYTIEFKSTDNAGNIATATRTVKVDASVPAILTSTTGTEGSSGWYVSQTTTSIAADELSGVDHIEYNQNDTGWQAGSSFVSVEGINKIDIKIYDVAGNVASQTLEIKVDTTPPIISTSVSGTKGLADWYVSQTTIGISAHDEVSGVDHIEYDQDSGGWQNGISITSDDGVNTIVIRAFDLAGNISSKSLEIKVDTTAPTLTPLVPTPDGLNNWFISAPVPVSVNGSDSGSGLASVALSVDESDWQPDASLRDGVYIVNFQAFDNAGNSTTASETVKIDTVAPVLSTSIAGTKGNSGWYVSQATTTISARDETSSVDRIEFNQNKAGWKEGTSVLSKDGINEIAVRAYDLAGNMSSGSIQVKVDTEKPVSQFTSPLNASTDTLIRGVYELYGSSSDTVSGVWTAEISLDRKSWLPLEVVSNGVWKYAWDTSSWVDGEYPVVVRTTDVAGNVEATDSGARVTLLVNNAPPHIKLTPEWFIWQSGYLVIKTEYFPVRDGMIEIADRDGRWPGVKIPFGEKYPAEIKWDRRFADGVLAPSGDYRVTVSACNIFDLCSQKKAIIKIPWIAIVLPTEPVATQLVEVEPPPITEPLPTSVLPVVELPNMETEIHAESKSGYQPALSSLSFVVLIALMWAVSSAALSDNRPAAICAIAKTITSQKRKGEFSYE